MSRKKRNTSSNAIRESLLENIRNRKSLPSHVVVSAVQGLVRVAEIGDEEILFALLDDKDKSVAGVALSVLSIHYPELPRLNDRIVEFASTYPHDGEEDDLHTRAIIALERMAKTDHLMFKKMIEIAENYSELQNPSNDYSDPASIPSEALNMNAFVWEALARLCDDKIRGVEHTELTWNPHSLLSEKIRDRIREKYATIVTE